MLGEAIVTYLNTFRPSKWLARPYFMMAAGLCAADTDEEAEYLRTSQVLAFAHLRSGQPGKLPFPTRDVAAEVHEHMSAVFGAVAAAIGIWRRSRQGARRAVSPMSPKAINTQASE